MTSFIACFFVCNNVQAQCPAESAWLRRLVPYQEETLVVLDPQKI